MKSASPPLRRRTVLLFTGTAVGGVLLPRAVRPQPLKLHRIGYLSPAATPLDDSLLALFRQGLQTLGYKDDDLVLEVRSANGQIERLPEMAAELVRLGPEVIIALGPAVQAAKQATSTIPIVLLNVADPVAAGFVASLAHPGGNITGLANLAQETTGKRLQLLQEASPSIRRVAFLVNPANRGNMLQLEAARQAAPTLRIELVAVEAQAAAEIESAFAAMEREHANALFVPADPVFGQTSLQIAELAAKQKLPAIYQGREYVEVGGLLSYGPDFGELARQAARFVDKILKGTKPADLPVEQPTKFDLIVNLKAARGLGLAIPPSILALADEVIE